MSMKFYTNPMSRGQIARWALHETGVDYDEVLLDYGSAMATPEYLAINPMAKVPAIVHDGRVVTEAAAICAYLARAFPDAELGPRTLDEAAAYERMMFFAAGPVEQSVVTRAMGWTVSDEPAIQGRLGFGSHERTIDALATLLGRSVYACGTRFTAADIYVGSQVDWGLRFKTMPERSEFIAYVERLRERPAYKAAKAIDETHILRARGEAD